MNLPAARTGEVVELGLCIIPSSALACIGVGKAIGGLPFTDHHFRRGGRVQVAIPRHDALVGPTCRDGPAPPGEVQSGARKHNARQPVP